MNSVRQIVYNDLFAIKFQIEKNIFTISTIQMYVNETLSLMASEYISNNKIIEHFDINQFAESLSKTMCVFVLKKFFFVIATCFYNEINSIRF